MLIPASQGLRRGLYGRPLSLGSSTTRLVTSTTSDRKVNQYLQSLNPEQLKGRVPLVQLFLMLRFQLLSRRAPKGCAPASKGPCSPPIRQPNKDHVMHT